MLGQCYVGNPMDGDVDHASKRHHLRGLGSTY